ncbi:MAG: HD-GYP domain-containing protein [Candidatus Scalindua sp.]|jgi:HD-GYP domain-containing protein (c-di-GMP phosphodiesterase class II)|nr:HD-GYP domain-containing protein [Candidatus Scalindua sp.]
MIKRNKKLVDIIDNDTVTEKYDKFPEYLPIDASNLKVDTKIGCDFYLLVETNGDRKFNLYCRGNIVYESDKRDRLLEKNINKLYIKNEDQQKYYEYMENNFIDIIADTNIPSDEKTKILYGAAKNLVKDLFNNPRTGNIERTKTFACNMVDYILKESNASYNLLTILVHEYYTYTHSVNVAAFGTLFAQSIGLGENELKSFCSGILLHDVGKTRISTELLNKKGKLTKDEYAMVKKHPEMGVEVLKESGIESHEECLIVLQHHENADGSGYPYGLRNNEVQLCSKIARIIDVYDALTTNRSYAKALGPFAALVEMKEKMSNYFDEEIFADFIRFLGLCDQRRTQRKDNK